MHTPWYSATDNSGLSPVTIKSALAASAVPMTTSSSGSGAMRGVGVGEMRLGRPIRDASPGDTAGPFLNAERGLLRDRGWTFDSKTIFWMPPKP